MSRGFCLVVEDDEDIAGLVTLVLAKEGFDVRAVHTASAALVQASELRPVLITLDLGLPDKDGLHIARDLRELTAAPIIMLTARARATDQMEGMAAGASAYLTKPFRPADLRDLAGRLCPAQQGTS